MKYLAVLCWLSTPFFAWGQVINRPQFYSNKGVEYRASFQAVFRTEFKSLEEARKVGTSSKRGQYEESYIYPTLTYLYGPLTNREIGNPQRGWKIDVRWDLAKMQNGNVLLPYTYSGSWILYKEYAGRAVVLPVPLTAYALETPNWKKCTDSEPDHQTMQMYWYYWDPDRDGCDQKEERDFIRVTIQLSAQTLNQTQTFPEYGHMIRNQGGQKVMSFTFAFGYVSEPTVFRPDHDKDYGAQQYQDFVNYVRLNLGSSTKESDILESEYPNAPAPNEVIGHRFTGKRGDVKVVVNVVTAGDIDQMLIFAKSFAHDHDGFFAWFGHSRVGAGFDADWMEYRLKSDASYYSIDPHYQLIYWAGCNSYSYYTSPFFRLKATSIDPKGTRGLDIISNGLPSFFALNSMNAKIMLKHLWNWQQRASFQTIVDEIEGRAAQYHTYVLVNVMGDEDNER